MVNGKHEYNYFITVYDCSISIRNSDTSQELTSIQLKNISKIALSPDAKVLVTYAAFRSMVCFLVFYLTTFIETADHPDGAENLHVFDVATGKILDSRIHVAAETW